MARILSRALILYIKTMKNGSTFVGVAKVLRKCTDSHWLPENT